MLNKKLLMGISNIEEIDTENALVFTLADEFDIDGNRFNFYKIDTNNNDQNNFNFYANNKKVNISSYSFKPNTQVIVKSKTNNFNYSGNFYQKSWAGPSSNGTIDSEYFFLAKSIDQPLPQWINKTTNIPKTSFRDFFQHSRLSFVPYNLFENNDQITLLTYSFYNCTNLTTPHDIPNNVTDMYCTFYKCTNLIGTLNIYSKIVSNSVYCFYNHSPSKNLDVYLPVCYDNHIYTSTFNSFKNYTVNRVNGVLVHDINNIDYSQPEFSMQLVVNTNINNSFKMYNIFGEWDIDYDDGNVVHYAHTNNSNITYNYTNNGIYNITVTNANISTISFRNTLGLTEVKSPLPKLHTAKSVDMFSNCSNLTTVPLNLFENNQEITNFSNCFRNCINLLVAPDLNGKQNVYIIFNNTFENCHNLVTPPEINCAGFSSSNMFRNCTNLSSIPTNIKNSSHMYCTFSNCGNLSGEISINFTHSLESLRYCFRNCYNLTKISLNGPNLGDIFDYAFQNCVNLKSISLTGLFNKTQFGSIFNNCYNLEDCQYQEILNKSSGSLGGAFRNCCNLHMNITYISNNVNTLYQTFDNCTNLTNICDLDYLTNCNEISLCFSRCTNLPRLPKLPSSIKKAVYAFNSCYNAVQNMSEYIIPENISNMTYMFSRCSNIYGTVTLPNNVINICDSFRNCTNITEIIMSNNLKDMTRACVGCYNLVSVSNIPQTVTDMYETFNSCPNLQGNINILSTNITDINRTFSNHNYNKPTPLPLNIYIYTHYDNGVQTTTYNTFLNDTSHEFTWVLDNTTDTGITLKSFNKKTTITPNITDGSTLFIYDLEKDISEPFICYSKQLEYHCYHPNYPAKQRSIDLSDIGDTYTLSIDMTSYDVETELLTIIIPDGFTATTEIKYGLYTYTSTNNTVQITVENGTEVSYIVKDIVNISDPSIQYAVQRDTLTVNEYKTIAITPKEVVKTNINLSYPFTTYSEFLNNLVDNNNFIIDSDLSAIVSGPSSFNKNNGTSYGYIEFTTPNGETELSVTCYASSESNYDFGAVYLGSVQYKPTPSQIKNNTLNTSDTNSKYLYRKSGTTLSSETITETLQPNTKYVLSFAYCKDNSGNVGEDRFIIENISFYVNY